jgi:ketosteroid isomerase-like protein
MIFPSWDRSAGHLPLAPRVAAQFKSGTSRTQVISAHKSGDLLVLVQIEHQTVLFAGDDAPQDWNLRVTQVYRREDNEWRIVHRHADPLLVMRSMDEAKELARNAQEVIQLGS